MSDPCVRPEQSVRPERSGAAGAAKSRGESGELAPPRASHPASLWLPCALYLAGIFWLSSQSDPIFRPPSFRNGDKVAHAAAYAGLGGLLCRAYAGSALAASPAFALAAITSSLYGASDEWHQSFVPRRSCDPLDWLSDTVGGMVGAATWLFLRARRAQASIR